MPVIVDDQTVRLYLAHFPGITSGWWNYAKIIKQQAGQDRRYLAYYESDEEIDPTRYF